MLQPRQRQGNSKRLSGYKGQQPPSDCFRIGAVSSPKSRDIDVQW
jgi:hypothetical protein